MILPGRWVGVGERTSARLSPRVQGRAFTGAACRRDWVVCAFPWGGGGGGTHCVSPVRRCPNCLPVLQRFGCSAAVRWPRQSRTVEGGQMCVGQGRPSPHWLTLVKRPSPDSGSP